MRSEQFEAFRTLEELRGLLEIERSIRWTRRWAWRNIIIAKLKFRLPSLYRALGETDPAIADVLRKLEGA